MWLKTFALMSALTPMSLAYGHTSLDTNSLLSRSGFHDQLGTIDFYEHSLDQLDARISELRGSIGGALHEAAASVSSANAESNRKQLTWGLGVFAGTILLMQSSLYGSDLSKLTPAEKFTNVAYALNGWSFGAIWIFEGQLSDPVVACGPADFERTLGGYPAFAAPRNPHSPFSFGENPFEAVQPELLVESQAFQLARLEEDLSNALGCVIGQAGSNAEAQVANHMLQEFLLAHRQRLGLVERIRETIFEEHLSGLV